MRQIILTFLLLHIVSAVFAQEYSHKQYDRIQRATNSGKEFKQWELFAETGNKPVPGIAAGVTYKANLQNIARLYEHADKAVSIIVKTATGKTYNLQLLASHPFAHDANIGYIDAAGRSPANYTTGHHYQGAIAGLEQSVATMSIFPDGAISVFFSNAEGNFTMAKHKDTGDLYVLFNSKDLLSKPAFNCKVNDEDVTAERGNYSKKTTATTPECKKVRVYWEMSYESLTQNGNITNTQNYAATLFNMMQAVYYNDGFVIELAGLYIWTSPDPYTQTSSNAWNTLIQFNNYWNAVKNSFGADMAMYIGQQGSSGYAFIEQLCYSSPATALYIHSSYNDVIYQSSDMYILCHEAGHVFGARHAHWCGWMTGPNSSCGAVDNCSTFESSSFCTTCPSIHDKYNNTQPWPASFMTYCTGYVNFSVGFGPYIRNYVGNIINNLQCLQPIVQPQLTATTICDSNGSITLGFAANNLGLAPYTYQWSTGDTTQHIQYLDTPGKYTVVVTDSNQCSAEAEVIVHKLPHPGNGLPLQLNMPLCCKDTTYYVPITTNLPEGMDACKTVGWLRSSMPVTSYQQFATLYASAGQGDLLESDNSNIIDNANSAVLSVKTPDSCKAITAYYYTPFVTRRARSSMIITNNGEFPIPVLLSSKQAGNSSVIGDTIVPGLVCTPAVPHDSCIITVIVSNYTGRADSMTMHINDASDNKIFFGTNYHGNGTYKIPVSTAVYPLQKMTVFVLDHNCPEAFACDTASCSMQVKREVYYPAVPALQADSACYAGTSVLLSFGPDSCKAGRVNDLEKNISAMSICPNPARGMAVLSYHSPFPGTGRVSIIDVVGKIMYSTPVPYVTGKNEHTLNVQGLAGGMYFVRFESHTGATHSLKLSVW